MAKKHRTHVFRGKTCTDAINKAKAKLGKNISVVSRRNVKMENLFSKLTAGKLGGDSIEVELEVAVNDPDAEPKAPPVKPAGNTNFVAPSHLLNKTYAKALEQAEKRAIPPQALPKAEIGEAASGLAGKLDDLTRAVERSNREKDELREEFYRMMAIQARGGLPKVDAPLLDQYNQLVDSDMAEELARELVEGIEDKGGPVDPEAAREELCEAVAKRIPAAGPILLHDDGRPTVVALIGPTGVGKSTTIAKLAVDFTVRMKKLVGLINEDRTRPGADGQLKNLGHIMGIPAESADSPEHVGRIVRSMSGLDLILLDTGGRSPRDREGLDELARVVRAANPHEVHLTLTTGASEKAVFETVARFKQVGFDRIIFTKLDENATHGALFNMASKLAEGLSYVTTGQKYTESLVSADSHILAGLVMGKYLVEEGGIAGVDGQRLAVMSRPGGSLSRVFDKGGDDVV